MRASGQASVLQLWLIHERLHESELNAIEAVHKAFLARAELELLLGERLGGER